MISAVAHLLSPPVSKTASVERNRRDRFKLLTFALLIGITGILCFSALSSHLAFAWTFGRPLFFFISSLLMSVFFVSIWLESPEKQESFYCSLFALLGVFADLLSLLVPPTSKAILFCTLLRGPFYLFLSLSFARAPKTFIDRGLSLTILSIGGGVIFSHLITISTSILFWWEFILAVAGGLFCLLQATHLQIKIAEKRNFTQARIIKLAVYGAGMILLFPLSRHFSAPSYDGIEDPTFWKKLFDLIYCGYLALIAVHEIIDQRLFLDKTPISPYHRSNNLPELLTGAVLVVDLKNSESLLLFGDSRGGATKWLEASLSYMWTAVTRYEGVLLTTEGDQIRAFFDQNLCENPVLNALAATDEIIHNLTLLKKQWEEKDPAAADIGPFRFRGAISQGNIRPTWQDVENIRYASWLEVSPSHPFLESARLMDLERTLEPNKKGSVQENHIVIREEAAQMIHEKLNSLGGSWVIRSQETIGKHGKPYKIAVYRPFSSKVHLSTAATTATEATSPTSSSDPLPKKARSL